MNQDILGCRLLHGNTLVSNDALHMIHKSHLVTIAEHTHQLAEKYQEKQQAVY